MGVEVILQKEPQTPGAHKIGATTSGLRIVDRRTCWKPQIPEKL